MPQQHYKKFSSAIDLSDADHVIIGSGYGGLTVATLLAKMGKKVVVLERHFKPGGFTHSFRRKNGFSWSVGVHYIGNVKEGGIRQLFDYLTGNKLKWSSLGEVYDVVHIGTDTYEFKAGKEAFRAQMKAYFPHDTESIDAYLRLIEKANKRGSAFFFEKTFEPFLSKSLGWIFKKRYAKFSAKTTLEVLTQITDNKRLIAVICGQCGNYGLSPKYSSFAAHAMVIGHFMEGGFYPSGGPEKLAEYTLDTLLANGGKVYVNADVQEIVVEKKRVKGIRVDDTFFPCKRVISNVGAANTFNRLLPDTISKICGADFQSVMPSSGHLCLYVGLDKSFRELRLPKHNVWSYANENLDDLLDNITLENVSQKFSYISFPSANDLEWELKHPGKATIQALTMGKYEWFAEYENEPWMHRKEAYNELKRNFEKNMLKHLYELFPQIEGHVIETEVSSPLSTRHFANYSSGEIYGLTHSPERFSLPFLRCDTRIKGLRLVGQDVTLVGVASTMLSGLLGATTILKFGSWRLFKDMASGTKKSEGSK